MDPAARIVAQHARTAQLLGVDFVPVYRPEGELEGGQVEAVAPRAASEAKTEPRPALKLGPAPAPEADPAPSPPRAGRAPASTIEAKADRLAAPAPVPIDDPAAALADLEARYCAACPHKAFGSPHTNIVFGEGNCRAKLMFIGEAPGAEEDRQGRPFCGPSGQMLDKWIGAMGLSRPDCYIANVLKVRPPNNATPTTEEARVSAPWLFEQIRIIAPQAIVTLGLPASRLLLGTTLSMGDLRGRWWTFTDPSGREVPVMPTYHPAFLLRAHTPENRQKVWSDLQRVMERLGLARGG